MKLIMRSACTINYIEVLEFIKKRAIKKGKPLKVSIFVGGPPAHTFASVMPLPEGMSEVSFAGVLAKGDLDMLKKTDIQSLQMLILLYVGNCLKMI